MLDTVTEGLEADASIVNIVLDNFVLVEPSTIAIMELLGQVPVVEGLEKISVNKFEPRPPQRTNGYTTKGVIPALKSSSIRSE
jgi:hypothetical protein